MEPGQKFTRLTAVGFAGRNAAGAVLWKFKCACGAQVIRRTGDVQAGKTKSCGCYRREVTRLLKRTHGQTNTKIYRIWKGITNRCLNKNNQHYRHYGGRGITVCKRWLKFENFFKDMGDIPQGAQGVDRINNNKGYSKVNCRWVTQIEQVRNRRGNRVYRWKGKKRALSEIAEMEGLSYGALLQRVTKCGWSFKEAMETPIKGYRRC